MHAFGGNTFDILMVDGQGDARFAAGSLETIDMIVEPEEDASCHRYDVEHDIALRDCRIGDRDLGLFEGHIASLKERDALGHPNLLPVGREPARLL